MQPWDTFSRPCCATDQGARTLIGPNLYGLFGRRAASLDGVVSGVRQSAWDVTAATAVQTRSTCSSV